MTARIPFRAATLVRSAAALLAFVSAAFAADVAAETPDWGGAYVGLQAGGVFGLSYPDITFEPGEEPAIGIAGFAAGPFAGYRLQLDSVVMGVEAGANWRGVSGASASGVFQEELQTDQIWDASLVVHAGVPFNDEVFVYGLGGLSAAAVRSRYESVQFGASPWGEDTVIGWTLGAGVERQVTGSLRGRLEYRFANYGRADVTCSICGPTAVDLQTHSITLGIGYYW